MKWEKNLYRVECRECEFVGFFKFETGEFFPASHYEKFQVTLTSSMSNAEAINLLNAKAEEFLIEANAQCEREQIEFQKHFEEFSAQSNIDGSCYE